MAHKKLTFFGCGAMGSAVVDGILLKKLYTPKDLIVIEPVPNPTTQKLKEKGALVVLNVNELPKDIKFETVLFAVKPQKKEEVFQVVGQFLTKDSLIISIMAGVQIETIEKGINVNFPLQIIRVMPNLPCSVLQAMSGYIGNNNVTQENYKIGVEILNACGKSLKVDNEQMIDVITAISGSGPAYFFYLAEAMIKAAEDLGIKKQDAQLLVSQTMTGAAALLTSTSKDPEELRKLVTSPGGTTEAAVKAFEKYEVKQGLILGCKAAFNRAQELSGKDVVERPIPVWATVNPWKLSEKNPHTIENLVLGKWKKSTRLTPIIDPLNGEKFIYSSNATDEELHQYKASMEQCPKSGLHNPIKNPERYNMMGTVFRRVAEELYKEDVIEFLTKLIQRVCPKSYIQAKGEIMIVRKFFENFSGDQARFLCRGFMVSGDHFGQQSQGYRFPYGPVLIISPFNFPLEIPSLQLGGALITGNKPLLKCAFIVSIVMEQFIRLMIHCGLPPDSLDFINCSGGQIEKLCKMTEFRMCQFTGSSEIAEHLCQLLHGKIKIEDAGFDWKILGPDVSDFDYVCWQSDQDAYALAGQKCSAQSIIFAHENWMKAGLVDRLKQIAEKRTYKDLTNCPILSWTNKAISEHQRKILEIPGAKILFGGKPSSEPHKIPECYGSYEPTAIFVPLDQILANDTNFKLVTTEVFGPFQIITEWKDDIDKKKVLACCEKMNLHLTAAVVSKDQQFLDEILANTVNGTTYAGIRARTTGAPQNHWFGPSNDPRCAGIGTPEAILLVWTSHREIIKDTGPVPSNWVQPKPS